jgi:prostaglandin reductase 3
MLPNTYKKLVAVQSSNNLREAAQVQEVPLESPKHGEIVVKTRYSGVNAADYLMAAGRYLAPTPPPYDMGSESCGEIVAIGEGVTDWQVGDAVFAIGGGFREYFTIPANRAIRVPVANAAAVTIGVSGLTASIALEKVGEMTQNETVLVTAAAGGTGNFVVQLAKINGNHVIGTCSSPDKIDFLKSIGCDRPINYKDESLSQVLKSEYPKGIDIIFESVGGKQYDTALNALAVRGRLIVIGAISEYESGPQEVTRIRDSYKILNKSASIRGFWLMHYFRHAQEHASRLIELMSAGKLIAAVDPKPFEGVEGALDAIEYMYTGQNVGKVVVAF